MKSMKKRISFLLVMVMLFAMLAVPAYAVEVQDGKAIVSDTEVETAIAEATEETVVIDFSNVDELVTGVEISASALTMIADTGKTLTVATGVAKLEVNQATLNSVVAQVGEKGNVTLAIELMPMLTLTPAQLGAVNECVVWFETSILYGHEQLEIGEGGSITVVLAEAIVGAMGGDGYDVALLDQDGKFHLVETESVDGNLVAELSELAVYALVEKGMVKPEEPEEPEVPEVPEEPEEPEVPEEPVVPVNPFVDVADDAWYLNPVLWAVGKGITGGTSPTTFSPDNFCTRAQVVTFLYAAAGKPEVDVANNPFADVAEDAWYLKPVMWAVENGITGGTSPTTFGPDNFCTRAQVVTFLYAAAGKPEVDVVNNPFADVAEDAWYLKPVLWAVENGITGGISPTTFGPDNFCTRAQVVTFLYADAGKPAIK